MIRMRPLSEPDLSIVSRLTGTIPFSALCGKKRLPIFSEEAIEFLSVLSRVLLNDPEARRYPDLTSYAFWIRNASLLRARDSFGESPVPAVGRGVAFHIAPSNVPVAFAVSFTSALLAGNCSIVRISEKQYPQTELIRRAVLEAERRVPAMSDYVNLVRYPHMDEINAYFSSLCDLRILWGGNRTISEIRKFELPPRSVELTFADRFSLAVLDADAYAGVDPEEIARRFYTDTFYSDQNACSSPRLVVWLGHPSGELRSRFWRTLRTLAASDYPLSAIQTLDKWNAFCRLSVEDPSIRLVRDDNFIFRVEVASPDAAMMKYKTGGGYFFECCVDSLSDLLPALTKSCQTISCFGVDPECIRALVMEHGVRGVDRTVRIGDTMGLSFFWDGVDMIRAMSRLVDDSSLS